MSRTWICVHDRGDALSDIRTAYYKLSQLILGANSLIQSVLPNILTPVKNSPEESSLVAFKHSYVSLLESNATATVMALSAIKGLTVVVPQGAM